ncbi:MAG: PExPT-CTERM protein [Nevskiales bacterium]
MTKQIIRIAAVCGLMCVAGNALAFGGCVDSPENPSVVLGLLGGGAACLPWLRARLRTRLSKRSSISAPSSEDVRTGSQG